MKGLIKRILQVSFVSFIIVFLGMLLLAWTKPSFWQTFFNKELLEILYYLSQIVLPLGAVFGFLWWLLFGSGQASPKELGSDESGESGNNSALQEARPASDPFEQQLAHYLRWLINHHSSTRLHGLLDLNKAGKTQSLRTIYTSLRVSHRSGLALDEANNEVHRPTWRVGAGEAGQDEVDMAELLTLGERVAIIGGAGSGKTTYLDFVAVALAEALGGKGLDRRLKPPQADAPLPIPFVAPLRVWNVYRDYCERQPERSLDYPDHNRLTGFLRWYLRTNCDYNKEEADRFFDRVLKEREVLLMFDGLDEVVEASERQVMRSEINNLLKNPRYHKPRCLVTAREAGYKSAPFGDEFLRCDIQPMSEGQIEGLVSNWCEKLPDMERGAKDDIVRVIGQMNAKRKQQGQPPLIATPLMVTMVVSVRYSQRELPKERAKLYDVVVKAILEKQYGADADAHGAREALITWGGPPDTQREWLSYLAFHMHKRKNGENGRHGRHGTDGKHGSAVADEATVRQILSDALTQRGEIEYLEPFVRAMRQRGGLFEERGEQFQFMHLTFQEFLAAEYLANEWRTHHHQLANWVTDSWWRETLLLTIGKLDSPIPFSQRQAFIDALLGLRNASNVVVAAAEIAALGLLDLRKPDKTLRQRVQKRLTNIFNDRTYLSTVSPALRANAGIALAQLGDTRANVMTVDGMEFCFVPAGRFWMGESRTLHQVDIDYGYWIARYPVSNAQFEEFVKDGGYEKEGFWLEAKEVGEWKDGKVGWTWKSPRARPDNFGSPYNLANHPVVGINWYEALAFTRWLAEKWGSKTRLPTEAEWEKAARGGIDIPAKPLICPATQLNNANALSLPMQSNPHPQRTHPWGNQLDQTLVNAEESGIGHTNALGCYPKGESPYGCAEMSGNVWEWCNSLYNPYPYRPDDGRERLKRAVNEPNSVLRGGSYFTTTIGVRCFSRHGSPPLIWHNDWGFRVFRPYHL